MPAHRSSLGVKAFGELADTSLIIAYESHQDALRFLSAALNQPNGIALLQGPAGAGKTTIVNEQLGWSSREAAAALVDGDQLTPRGLLTKMLSQFGEKTSRQDDDQMLQSVNDFMAWQAKTAESPVLIVDNADRASASTLRLLNWLAALDVQDRFALRIVLTGRERLSALVQDHSMLNIARRHPQTYSLNPLTERESIIYLRTRLIAAGGERIEKIFPLDVCDWLYERSRGWPGRLNHYALQVLDRSSELQSARPIPRVIVTKDGNTVAEYALTESKYVIGRSEMADIVIKDSYASKLHAMLQVYSNAIVLIDLNSTNGTTVNSHEVPKTILRNNDVISLGRHRLKLESAPAISADMSAQIRAADTLIMKNLEDLRRSRARRMISALKHR